MAIVMPEEATYELAPVGSHTATCYRIIDLGTQAGMYGPKRQILVSWELVDEQMTDGRPFTISRRYTLSSSSKATLRGDVEGWLGRTLTSADLGKLDLSQLLGTTCLIGIKHERKENGRTFANVTSVMRRAKAVPERLPCTSEAVSLSLADFREYEFQQLPQWIRDTIAKSPEYLAATKPAAPISTGTKKRLKAILADDSVPTVQPGIEDLDDDIPY